MTAKLKLKPFQGRKNFSVSIEKRPSDESACKNFANLQEDARRSDKSVPKQVCLDLTAPKSTNSLNLKTPRGRVCLNDIANY